MDNSEFSVVLTYNEVKFLKKMFDKATIDMHYEEFENWALETMTSNEYSHFMNTFYINDDK